MEPRTQEQYLANPSICPFCESGNIEGDSIEVDGLSAWQPITCLDCDETWTDVYKLVGYETY